MSPEKLSIPQRRIVAIRPKIYRGRVGFIVSGHCVPSDGGFWRPSVFTETRSSAEKIRTRLRAGSEVQLEDFAP